ncbi:CAP domain-containing protein [Clostridium swellfunianum]|uniref:CAP domain-containing protein n=1 Tax=Clostridium swellfunianum TaxID=1367462 RepID=UPI0020302BBB|nr:CAP domain-containing protein [Clostridium swellfunianum]
MKRKIYVFALGLSLIFTASCTPRQKSFINNKLPNNGQITGHSQPIQGIESSVSKIGDIQKVKVIVDKANITSGCGSNTSVLQSAAKNNTLDVVSQVSDWFAVKLPNNQIGFVPKSQAKPIVVENKTPQITTDASGSGAAPSQASGGVTNSTAPKTPSAQTNSSTLTSQEQEMLKLINQARAQNNVSPLQIDMQVTNVARVKAQDMIDNNYFSHNSPKYGSPFDMLKAFGVSYVEAGENIAGNQTIQNAHNALMNSPGHRKNILNPDYTHIGLGIRNGGPYGNMFSQMFVSKPK